MGKTIDTDKRLKRHNQGIVQSTAYGIPWKLVLKLKVVSRSEAMLLEKQIKKRGAKRYLDDHFGV